MEVDNKIIGEGLTFDDVLIVPQYSEVLPHLVKTKSRFSRNIELNVPLVSAAMDTVTESSMAIAIAQEGGIGVLHKNMSIESQSLEVRKVKRSESGMILDPITLNKFAIVGDALQIMKENKIGGIPVVDSENKLVGIVTNRDLRFEKDMGQSVLDIMTSDDIVTTELTDLENAERILQENKIEKLPVINSDNKLVGLITFKDIIKNRMRPNACKDKFGRLRVAAAVGVTGDVMERVEALAESSVDAIIIDTAHGHSKGVIDILKKVKEEYKNIDIIVGNIATADAAKMLIDAGADAVKVGIGPGSICTTRIVAGIGVP
ncbi:MAG: IMP dehydrogenase, partial [Flavobacteriales bacterium]|nr:IMP dehydrogenase [Flavobacteriales bacterium]